MASEIHLAACFLAPAALVPCGSAGGTTGKRFNSAQQATCFRASARNFFWGYSIGTKTGVLRKQNPGFCAARAAIGRLLKRFSRFGRKNRQFFLWRALELLFAVPQGIPVISALPEGFFGGKGGFV